MAEFSKLIITAKGQTLIAKILAGSHGVEFTKIVASSDVYSIEDLEGIDAIIAKQTTMISRIEQTNDVAVKIEGAFNNTELTEGYYMRTIGLYAVDPDEGEILYAVTVETSGNCYMPAYNGVTVSGAYVQLISTIGNAENVSLEVDPAAVATIRDLKELENRVEALEISSGELLTGYYYDPNGSITDGTFYEDRDHTIEMEKKNESLYIDLISRHRLYWCDGDKYRLIASTDTPDWEVESGPGYIANKPDISGRNAIRVIMNGSFTLTLDDPQANIIGMGAAYFKNGLDFNITSVTISGTTATQVQNNGPGKPVRIYAQAGITTTTPGIKTISIYSYNGSTSSLYATGQIYAPVSGKYTVATCTSTALVAAGYVYIKISGATGDVITNQNNLTFLTVDEI